MVTFKAVNVEVVCLVLHKCLDFFFCMFSVSIAFDSENECFTEHV